MSVDKPPESAVQAVRRWEELAADRAAAADRVAVQRADAQARAVELLADARQRGQREAVNRRRQVLDPARAEADLTRAASSAAVTELQAAAAARREDLLRAALDVILPTAADRQPMGPTGSGAA